MNYLTPRLALRRAVAAVGLSIVAGCGLISSDVTNFELSLPDKRFTIDASNWHVDTTKASSLFTPDGKLQSLACGTNPSVCGSAVTAACPMGCSGVCNANNVCEMTLDISLSQPVDLVKEQPDLAAINDQPVIKVAIDSVTYQVLSNNLNVATPDIAVSVATMSVLKASDPGAQRIGTIPSIDAGWTTSGPEMLMFTPTGKAQLVELMSHFKTPFNVWVGSSLRITTGQVLPTGKLEAVVSVRGHAGL